MFILLPRDNINMVDCGFFRIKQLIAMVNAIKVCINLVEKYAYYPFLGIPLLDRYNIFVL